MSFSSSVTITLLTCALLCSARPLSVSTGNPKINNKRNIATNSRTVGTGFAIAVFLILLFGIAFHLGRRRERMGTWFCWGACDSKTTSKPENLSELEVTLEPSRLKSRISCPITVSSSAPVELQSPISLAEAESRPRFLEMPSKEIYEMGLPSPRPRRPSWIDRTTWWIRYSDRKTESKTRNDKDRRAESVGPPSYPEAVHQQSTKLQSPEKGRDSSGSALIDWRSSGLEYIRHVYAQKKTDLAVEGTPWY